MPSSRFKGCSDKHPDVPAHSGHVDQRLFASPADRPDPAEVLLLARCLMANSDPLLSLFDQHHRKWPETP
jgi:hypothetical protein